MRNGAELASAVRAFGVERFCIKPVESWAGRGFRTVTLLDGEPPRVRAPGAEDGLDLEAFCRDTLALSRGASYIVERHIEQHEWYAARNESSVNTFRVWVTRGAERARTRLAYLRMGRRGSFVDNQSAGGVVAPLDLETLRLGAIIDGLPGRETWLRHPDCAAPGAGETPPLAAEALALAEAAIAVFPHLRFAGVDIAMTPSGPCVIELNTSPDREGAAFTDIPTRRALIAPG
jgi:hypothetical protein